MKLTKENIYINLRGKSKEELTEFYNFLVSVGEKPFRDKEWFLNYSNDNEKVGFSGVHFCGLGDLYKDRTEVTIQQLKEILQPMKEFTPTAMRCTQEQFDAIKPKLKDCIITNIWFFDNFNYLVNNCNGTERHIINVEYSNKDMYNRKVYKTWNEEIFLKACGIETETLQEKEQRLLKELEETRKAIEEENEIKVGDLVKCTNKHSDAKCVIGLVEDLHAGYVGVGGHWYDKFEKITGSVLIESLNKLF